MTDVRRRGRPSKMWSLEEAAGHILYQNEEHFTRPRERALKYEAAWAALTSTQRQVIDLYIKILVEDRDGATPFPEPITWPSFRKQASSTRLPVEFPSEAGWTTIAAVFSSVDVPCDGQPDGWITFDWSELQSHFLRGDLQAVEIGEAMRPLPNWISALEVAELRAVYQLALFGSRGEEPPAELAKAWRLLLAKKMREGGYLLPGRKKPVSDDWQELDRTSWKILRRQTVEGMTGRRGHTDDLAIGQQLLANSLLVDAGNGYSKVAVQKAFPLRTPGRPQSVDVTMVEKLAAFMYLNDLTPDVSAIFSAHRSRALLNVRKVEAKAAVREDQEVLRAIKQDGSSSIYSGDLLDAKDRLKDHSAELRKLDREIAEATLPIERAWGDLDEQQTCFVTAWFGGRPADNLSVLKTRDGFRALREHVFQRLDAMMNDRGRLEGLIARTADEIRGKSEDDQSSEDRVFLQNYKSDQRGLIARERLPYIARYNAWKELLWSKGAPKWKEPSYWE